MKLKILDLLPQEDVILVGGELVSGDLSGNIITCVETGGKWEFAGIGLINLDAKEKGL